MVDIKERLADYGLTLEPDVVICDRRTIDEAVSRISELAAENERLKRAIADHPRDTNTVDAHETANVSDKPEGQQEPVAWGEFYGGKIATVRTDKSRHCTVPLFTRPSEQAVTEALVERMCRTPFIEGFTPTTDEWQRCETVQDQYDLMKRRIREGMAALKAAMEAGR